MKDKKLQIELAFKIYWKDIPNYEGVYQASTDGQVRSLDRFVSNRRSKGVLLKPKTSTTNYKEVNLHLNGVGKMYRVHQLVAMAFLGHEPCGLKIVVDHIDGNPLNNKLENLQLITTRENTNKGIDLGLSKYRGVHSYRGKWMSRIMINGIREYLGTFEKEEDANKAYQDRLKAATKIIKNE